MAEATTRIEAEFDEGKRVLFTARERSSVNVRIDSADGGPVGYASYELLLIALADCTLGVAMNHESLRDEPVQGCRAVIQATASRGTSRVGSIAEGIALDVGGGTEGLRGT